MRTTTISSLVIFAALAVTACSNRSTQQEVQGTQDKSTAPVSSDAEVMSVAITINTGEIEMAELAQKQAQSTDVQQLAAMILADHQKSSEEFGSLEETTTLQPKENKVSSDLDTSVEQAMKRLTDQTGATFDRDYVQTQIDMHEQGLHIIDTKLMPAVKNEQLQSAMRSLRDIVVSHLDKSRSVMQKLNVTARAG